MEKNLCNTSSAVQKEIQGKVMVDQETNGELFIFLSTYLSIVSTCDAKDAATVVQKKKQH